MNHSFMYVSLRSAFDFFFKRKLFFYSHIAVFFKMTSLYLNEMLTGDVSISNSFLKL